MYKNHKMLLMKAMLKHLKCKPAIYRTIVYCFIYSNQGDKEKVGTCVMFMYSNG